MDATEYSLRKEIAHLRKELDALKALVRKLVDLTGDDAWILSHEVEVLDQAELD